MSDIYEPKRCDGSPVKGELIIGQIYLVPGVDMWHHRFKGWFPIVGTLHRDEDLDVATAHYHPDYRFAAEREYERLTWQLYGRPTAGYALGAIRHAVAGEPCDVLKVTWRRRKLRRHNPEFPLLKDGKWILFHKAHEGQEVKCGRCPHRGVNLNHIPTENGRVICHGHGLLIDMNKGVVLNRLKETTK